MKIGYVIPGIGAAAACGVVLLLLVAAPFMFHTFVSMQAAHSVMLDYFAKKVSVEVPAGVPYGETFELEMTVENPTGKPRKIVGIHVADAYLEGIAVRRSSPPFRDSTRVPFDSTVSYTYDLPLPPHDEVRVVFEMYALHAGDFRGDFEVCIDSEAFCVPKPVRTMVRIRGE